MLKHLKIILFLIITLPAMAQNRFKTEQLKFERVKDAYADKWMALQKSLQSAGFSVPFELYLSAYKKEGKLEIWIKTAAEYKLFKTYDFCAHSGTLGPKVVEGDGQTPEGFYKINVFNPMSNYHLSLGINYPNKVDIARTGKGNKTGGDIYIHGDCVTIGCIPLTDDKIKEVYVLAVEARNAGQQDIQVSIYPFRMTAANMKKYGADYPQQVSFWQSLQKGYIAFETDKQPPKISLVNGSYITK